jgi:hypothetical protein
MAMTALAVDRWDQPGNIVEPPHDVTPDYAGNRVLSVPEDLAPSLLISAS